MGESVLIVPVPAVEPTVRRLRNKLDPASRAGLPAHVTVLYPFAPTPLQNDVVDDLARLFATVDRFDFELSGVGWFEDRVLYLAPNPPEPFQALTARVAARHPDYLPYGGAFPTVIPHLTVGEGGRHKAMARAAHRLQKRIPLYATAAEVWLMAEGRDGRNWYIDHVFPLGPAGRS
jgi:2'-5' RNA ligase